MRATPSPTTSPSCGSDARLLAGGEPARRGPRGPRLGSRRPRPPDPAPLCRPNLRGHGRDRPRRRGRRRAACAVPRTPRLGAPRTPAPAAHGPRRRDRRARARPPARPVRRGPARSRARLLASPAIWAQRSRPRAGHAARRAQPPRRGRGTPTRSPARTASATRSTPPTARCVSARTPRSRSSCTACGSRCRGCYRPPEAPRDGTSADLLPLRVLLKRFTLNAGSRPARSGPLRRAVVAAGSAKREIGLRFVRVRRGTSLDKLGERSGSG